MENWQLVSGEMCNGTPFIGRMQDSNTHMLLNIYGSVSKEAKMDTLGQPWIRIDKKIKFNRYK